MKKRPPTSPTLLAMAKPTLSTSLASPLAMLFEQINKNGAFAKQVGGHHLRDRSLANANFVGEIGGTCPRKEKIMANCTKCGQPLEKGLKFCPSCGTAVTSGTAKKNAPAESATEGAVMGKIAVIAVTAACAVTVIFFFFSFFAVSFAGSSTGVNGMQAAVGSGRMGSASPALLLVWFFAIAMLVALYVPIVRQKLESVQLPAINVPVIGGLSIFAYLAIIIAFIGLIMLIAAYSSTIGYLKREFAGYNTYLSILGGSVFLKIGTGIGFKMVVFAQIILLGIPFVDKYFLRKRG